MKSDSFDPYTPKRILAIGAHADDIDFGASGSLAIWAQLGAVVEYLVLTDGSKGTNDTSVQADDLVELRQQEQRAAAEVLGATKVHFLNYEDGTLELTMGLKKDIVRVIRQVQPDTVVTLDPTMIYSSQFGIIDHPDHRATGQASLDAVYPLARDHLSFPELLNLEHLEPHKVEHVLLLNLDKHNCIMDITETFDMKLAALSKHASQGFGDQHIAEVVTRIAKNIGTATGCEYAEGFVRIDCPA